MATYANFGATTAGVIAMYPGSVAADFGGTSAIQAVLDRISREVAGALVPKAYRVLAERVDLEMVEDYASDGQTAFTLGLTPQVSGSLHMWRFSRDAILRTKPVPGISELTVTSHTVATGAVVVSDTIGLGDKVFATYELDSEAAAFSWPSVSDVVLLGAAAELGARLYTSANQDEWALVTDYREKYRGRYVVQEGGTLRMIRSGNWMPDELRTLMFWTEIDVDGASMGSVDLFRG